LRELAPYGGLSPYADTKYRIEGLMDEFVKSQSMVSGAIALRFFNVYGPRQDLKNPYSGAISLFLEMARGGKNITILWEMA
jgi:UDP-glucose 4-epimerase